MDLTVVTDEGNAVFGAAQGMNTEQLLRQLSRLSCPQLDRLRMAVRLESSRRKEVLHDSSRS